MRQFSFNAIPGPFRSFSGSIKPGLSSFIVFQLWPDCFPIIRAKILAGDKTVSFPLDRNANRSTEELIDADGLSEVTNSCSTCLSKSLLSRLI